MSKKAREYIKETARCIEQLQEHFEKALNEMTEETATICGYSLMQTIVLNKTNEILLIILSRIDEIGDAINDKP